VVDDAVGLVVVPDGDVEVVVGVDAVKGDGFYRIPCIVDKIRILFTCLV
jgi:hypothetical protein